MTKNVSQGIDYLGFLEGKLRDLQGYATLAHELIQNADDALAETMCFDVCDHALIVENSSVFSDCGLAEEEDECPWKDPAAKGHRCDFHRFRKVAGADKREEEETTGAFGIGFISVYQITDRPELRSGRRHWKIYPDETESARIKADDSPLDEVTYTRFTLPWATDPKSPLRKRLRAQTIQMEQASREIVDVLSRTLPNAILFLKNLLRIELRHNGTLLKVVKRSLNGDTIEVIEDGRKSVWRILRGDFNVAAGELRKRYPNQIESKRKANVAVAISVKGSSTLNGLFYACLPTEQSTQFPFHIDADFYPTTDRKRIHLTGDHQGAWNIAAISKAAELVAAAIPVFSGLLQADELWNLLNRLKDVHDQAEKNQAHTALSVFWRQALPKIKTTACVFSSEEQWLRPDDLFLVDREPDQETATLFNALGIKTIHASLRAFFSLFQHLGVSRLSLQDLALALLKAGLNQPIAREHAPWWLQSPQGYAALAQQIAALQATFKSKPNPVTACSIALAGDGWFRAPSTLYRCASELTAPLTVLGFTSRLLGEQNPDSVAGLVAELDSDKLLTLLADVPAKHFQTLWLEHKNLLNALINWFQAQRGLITDEIQKQRLRALPIWPSDNHVHTLEDLFIPGDFEDPIGLASILHSDIRRGRRDFLRDLGGKRLTIQTYARDFIPTALGRGSQVSSTQRRQLVLVLAGELGKLREDPRVRERLAACHLIECAAAAETNFYPAIGAYFNTEAVLLTLGKGVPRAVLPNDHADSVRALFQWLGVTDEPRLVDIVARIRLIVTQPPTLEHRNAIAQLFRHLSGREFAPVEPQLDALKTLRWLPAQNDGQNWHAPGNLYAIFQEYLFSSQATFLGFDRQLQSDASALISRLNIRTAPEPEKVVKHLLYCASLGKAVNMQVYRFLNDNWDDPIVLQLRGRPCLLLAHGYVAPDKVFWGEQPYGRFRYQLSSELHGYDRLLSRLNVAKAPGPQDAINVLQEIAEAFGSTIHPLDDEAYAVVLACWRQLGEVLERQSLAPEQLRKIEGFSVIPTEQRLLRVPSEMFFDDKPGVAERIRGSFKQDHIVPRILGVWQAMAAAGVRSLSDVVKVNIDERVDPQPAPKITALLKERRYMIARVIEAHREEGVASTDLALLDGLVITRVKRLVIDYFVRLGSRWWSSTSEEVAAYLDHDTNELTVQPDSSRLWFALARELASALAGQGEAIRLVGGLKEVLAAETVLAAAEALNELGYARLEVVEPMQLGQNPVGFAEQSTTTTEEAANSSEADGHQDITDPLAAVKALLGDDAPPPVALPSGLAESEPARNGQGGATVQAGTNGLGSSSTGGTSGQRTHGSAGTGEGDSVGRSQLPAITPVSGSQGGQPVQNGTGTQQKNGRDQSYPSGASTTPRPPKRRGGKLRSYVVPKETQSAGQTTDNSERISEIDQAGIAAVLRYERAAGRIPEEMAHNNPGYDVISRDASGTAVRYIEVKSLAGYWDGEGVALSPTQLDHAHQLGSLYWLYVVELADQANIEPLRVQGLAYHIDEFRFDDGWRALTEGQPEIVSES